MRLRFILLITATLSACNDINGPRAREISPVSRSQVSDARNGGATGFYFLPPIAPAITYTGAFDAKRSPVVLICRLEDAACTNPVAHLTSSGSGAQRVRVSIENEHYGVEWSTRGPGLLPGATYRVRVLDGATELGYADVRLLKTSAEAKALPSGIVGVVFGSTLAIKFRVEVSTVGPPVNATLGAAGGTVRVPLGAGGIFTLEVPPGALDAEVAFTITPRAPIAGKLASIGIAPANVLFAQPARISLSLPTTVASTLGKPAFVLGNGSFPLLLATDAVEPGKVFSARLPMLGDLPSFLGSQTATRVGYATRVSYAMSAAAEPSGDAIDLVIADAQQVVTAFLAAAADLDSKRSFTSAIKYRMEAAALAQWAGLDSLATEAIAAGQAAACAKLDQVTGLAPTALGTEFRDLWKALEPVLAWAAAAQSVGLIPEECPPLAAFRTGLSELVADFVTLYTAAMERSRFPSNAEGLQDQIYSALIVRKYGPPLGLDADFDLIKSLIQLPLAQRYRRAAYDFCRSDNSQHLIKEVFLAARDSVMYARNLPQVSALGQRVYADDDFGFDAADLSDDLQLCGTAIVVTSEDARGNRTLEGGIGGTSIPGQPERSLDIDANPHGKIELEGILIAFRCGEDVGNDVINVDFNSVRVRTWTRPQPTAHFIHNETKKFDVDSLAMVAGLDANGGGTFPLTLSREGNACDGSYSLPGAGTSTLLATINVKFPKIAVSVAPTTAALAPGENKTFTATVTGAANTDVRWTVTGGTFVVSGTSITYTAGATAGSFSVKATSVADSLQSASASIAIADQCQAAAARNPSRSSSAMLSLASTCEFRNVSVTPSTVSLGRFQTTQFSASVAGLQDQAVTWTATGGTISPDGLYSAGSTPGKFRVIAASVADPSLRDTAQVTIVDLQGITVEAQMLVSAHADQYGAPGCAYRAPIPFNALGYSDAYECNDAGRTGEETTATAHGKANQTWSLTAEANGVQLIRISAHGEGTIAGAGRGSVYGDGNNRLVICFSTPRAYTYQITGSISAQPADETNSGGAGVTLYVPAGRPQFEVKYQAYVGSAGGPTAPASATLNGSGLLLPGNYCFLAEAYGGAGVTSASVVPKNGYGDLLGVQLRLTP